MSSILGEIGLDFSPNNTVSPDLQASAFYDQLKMAMERKLPLCLHIRDDHDNMAFQVLEDAQVPKTYPIHLHWYVFFLKV